MNLNSKLYEWHARVRDYELDFQGVVHHAHYLHYLEQCRNDYAKTLGLDLHELRVAGFDIVVVNIELRYKKPLLAGDEFIVTAILRRDGEFKLIFAQEIVHKISRQLMAKAEVMCVCVDAKQKKLAMPGIVASKIPS